MIETEVYKAQLEQEKKTLYTELTELGFQNPEVAKDWVATPGDISATQADENVVADRAEDWIEKRGEMSVLETRYNNVLRALEKIEKGTYGICEISGAAIEPERLAANPAARTCMAHMNDEVNLPL